MRRAWAKDRVRGLPSGAQSALTPQITSQLFFFLSQSIWGTRQSRCYQV